MGHGAGRSAAVWGWAASVPALRAGDVVVLRADWGCTVSGGELLTPIVLRVPAQSWRTYRHGVEREETAAACTVVVELDSAELWALVRKAARNKSGRSKSGPAIAKVRYHGGGAR